MKKIIPMLVLLASSTSVSAYELIETDLAYLNLYGEIKARALFLEDKKDDYTFGESEIGLEGFYAVTDAIALAGGVEAEINLDADEDKNEDDLYLSQYFIGTRTEAFGTLTFGKHNTSSDDINGVDYSEVFGGLSNLNAVGVKDKTLKYNYDNELFMFNATYGFEAGNQNRTLSEVFGKYYLADLTLQGGVGTSSTDTVTNNKDSIYSHLTAIWEMGDFNVGTTYYFNTTDDNAIKQNSYDKNALAISGQFAVVAGLTTYAGYEFIHQSSDSSSIDGNLHNSYLGASYLFAQWARFYGEVNYEKTVDNDSNVNLGLGAALKW